jgi:glycosyltransferase involved in cell wall biosynthesis
MKINNISIVIPILNEEKNLTKLIKEIKKVKKK